MTPTMPVIPIDHKFVAEMAEIHANPELLHPRRPDLCRAASLSARIRLAWLVFTGRADAVIWPEDQ